MLLLVFVIISLNLTVFLSVSLGFILYNILYSTIVQKMEVESEYLNHKIMIRTDIWKVSLFIDGKLVDRIYNAFKMNVTLTGKINESLIKVNIFLSLRLDFQYLLNRINNKIITLNVYIYKKTK